VVCLKFLNKGCVKVCVTKKINAKPSVYWVLNLTGSGWKQIWLFYNYIVYPWFNALRK
jgi:hypothetical protein